MCYLFEPSYHSFDKLSAVCQIYYGIAIRQLTVCTANLLNFIKNYTSFIT